MSKEQYKFYISILECGNASFTINGNICMGTQNTSNKLSIELRFMLYINEMVIPVKYNCILIIIYGIYNRCQQMKVKVVYRKFECRQDIHYKNQTGTSCEKCNSKAFRLGIESASSGLLDQYSTTELQKPLLTTWARVGIL